MVLQQEVVPIQMCAEWMPNEEGCGEGDSKFLSRDEVMRKVGA